MTHTRVSAQSRTAAARAPIYTKAQVVHVQKELKALGLLPRSSPAKGDVDAKTKLALKMFQASQGIGQTGVPGPQTRTALDSTFNAVRRTSARQGPATSAQQKSDEQVALEFYKN